MQQIAVHRTQEHASQHMLPDGLLSIYGTALHKSGQGAALMRPETGCLHTAETDTVACWAEAGSSLTRESSLLSVCTPPFHQSQDSFQRERELRQGFDPVCLYTGLRRTWDPQSGNSSQVSAAIGTQLSQSSTSQWKQHHH